MAINLVKGQNIDLRKSDKGESYDLSKVTIGLGWKVRQKQSGFIEKLFGRKEEEYDLDAIAFLLDSKGKVADLGRNVQRSGRNIGLFGGDVIYFNSLQHPSGHIWLTGDNRIGGEGNDDDEQIIVKLDSLSEKYQKILFVVSIYQGRQNNQHFGMVENAFIRAVDARGKEILKFSLSGDSTYNRMCSMVFAELYRHNGDWKFRAIGEPHSTDNFVDILRRYIY